jgi:energy-coupling factor transport system permease protein
VHPGSWVAWLALVMALALTASNPLYLAVLLLAVLLVAAFAPPSGQPALGFAAMLVFGAGIVGMSLLVAIVNGTFGDHVLFTVPGPDVPRWLGGLSIGGPVSAEGLVAAGVRGLAILCVVASFSTFNRSVTPQRVLRTAPAALFHAGLVVTIGLVLLPATIADVRRIREMRALRGAPTGLRSAPALLVPALIGGLERAMRTAEAMEARGYASATPLPRRAQALLTAAPAALVVAAWLWFFYPEWKAAAIAAAAAAAAMLGTAAIVAQRGRTVTRLASEPYPRLERAAAFVSAVAAFALVTTGVPGLDFDYNPFAGLESPVFGVVEAAAVLATGWPVAAFIAGTPAPRLREAGALAESAR